MKTRSEELNRVFKYFDVRLKFLLPALLCGAASLACAGVARAQEKPAGELPRGGFAGVQVGPVPEDLCARLRVPAAQGLLVIRVAAGSAAAGAGVAEGDVILEAAGRPMGSAAEYFEQRRGGAPPELQTKVFDEIERWPTAAAGRT